MRFIFVFSAYMAQGLPLGLFFYAIPAWLAANDTSALAIGGYISLTSLPWTLKFVNGFIMDRFTYLAMGKRRAWVISAQTIMLAGLVLGAVISPGVTDIAILAAISFAINVATTFQDVAIDGLAVDLIPDEERPRANGLMFGGQAVGIALGAALSGAAISSFGLSAAFALVALLVSAILILVIVSRERPGERLLPWTAGAPSEAAKNQKVEAWFPLLKSVWGAMWRRDSFLLSGAVMMNGVAFGLFLAVGPLIATNVGGWSDTGYSSLVGLSSLVAGLCGVVVFGVLVDKVGVRFGGVSGFLGLSVVALAMIILQPQWAQSWTIIGLVFAFGLLDIYLKVSTCSTAMRLCDVKVAATQFTLYMALANLGMTLAGLMTGPLDRLGGMPALLMAMSVAGLLGAGAFSMIRHSQLATPQLSPIID